MNKTYGILFVGNYQDCIFNINISYITYIKVNGISKMNRIYFTNELRKLDIRLVCLFFFQNQN